MHKFLLLLLPVTASLAMPAAADAPVIATKKYVDSGLAARVKNTMFDSFKTSAEAFRNRAAGFATADQGNKADSAVQPAALDNYVPKSGGTITGVLNVPTPALP
ncbi:MAG: hypothetical protein LBB08_00525 [Rickettsiales bacterium]|jgi:phage-related tail fiber protein|nr:hypothetical protein [Rickettsiales bacterium]